MTIKPSKEELRTLACTFFDAQHCGPPAEMLQDRDVRMRELADRLTGKVPTTQRGYMRQFGQRTMIFNALRGKNRPFKWWFEFVGDLVKLFGMPKAQPEPKKKR